MLRSVFAVCLNDVVYFVLQYTFNAGHVHQHLYYSRPCPLYMCHLLLC